MDISILVEEFNKKAAGVAAIGGTLKMVIDGKAVYIDGTGSTNVVTTENKEADCTITTSEETMMGLQSGDVNPMMAVMSGKVSIKGDMGLAMQLQSLI